MTCSSEEPSSSSERQMHSDCRARFRGADALACGAPFGLPCSHTRFGVPIFESSAISSRRR
eukprot:388026-Prymnesium_polylepis.1